MMYTEWDRINTYLDSLEPNLEELDPVLARIRQEALAEGVPIIRLQMQSFLRTLLTALRPARVLEIGTAVGFSALWMAACTGPDCTITTIENDENRLVRARENLSLHPLGQRVTLLAGDAGEILPELVRNSASYDLIFMDAAKGQYPVFLPALKRLLPVGGVLVTDNVLQEGDILESRYAVERRDRTIHKRMRAYLRMLKEDSELVTSILPAADGVAVSVKRAMEEAQKDHRKA